MSINHIVDSKKPEKINNQLIKIGELFIGPLLISIALFVISFCLVQTQTNVVYNLWISYSTAAFLSAIIAFSCSGLYIHENDNLLKKEANIQGIAIWIIALLSQFISYVTILLIFIYDLSYLSIIASTIFFLLGGMGLIITMNSVSTTEKEQENDTIKLSMAGAAMAGGTLKPEAKSTQITASLIESKALRNKPKKEKYEHIFIDDGYTTNVALKNLNELIRVLPKMNIDPSPIIATLDIIESTGGHSLVNTQVNEIVPALFDLYNALVIKLNLSSVSGADKKERKLINDFMRVLNSENIKSIDNLTANDVEDMTTLLARLEKNVAEE